MYFAWLPLGALLSLLVIGGKAMDDISSLCSQNEGTSLYFHVFCERKKAMDTSSPNLGDTGEEEEEEEASSFQLENNLPASHASSYASGPGPGLFVGMRLRRGGNYIRFGRSTDNIESLLRYISPFSDLGRTERGDGHYVRFGRSVNDWKNEDSSYMDEDTPKMSYLMPNMRKRFMRFGRPDNANANADLLSGNDKRFMRFGKRADGAFMRFGKRYANGDGNQFMRFGKRLSPGFLAEPEEDTLFGTNMVLRSPPQLDKRFMRFGRNYNDLKPDLVWDGGDKRFMRFGKRSDDSSNRGISIENIDPNKRFMRFGKRYNFLPDEPMMRKRRSNDDDSEMFDEEFNQKSYASNPRFNFNIEDARLNLARLRQNKKDLAPLAELNKRFMRFGKRIPIADSETPDQLQNTYSQQGNNDVSKRQQEILEPGFVEPKNS